MKDIPLSQHFYLSEFVKSQEATRKNIPNIPGPKELENLKKLCHYVLQPLREIAGPLVINSGYRSPKLNQSIGGAKNSQHILGQAADIESIRFSNAELGKLLEKSGLRFDQLIYEFVKEDEPTSGWIHVSYNPDIEMNRRQVLRVG